MTTAASEEQTIVKVPARVGALAWLNAFSAASQDPERGILYRNLSLEFFPKGIQMVATDGTVLFRTWVGVDVEAEWPAVDEAPDRSVVAMDPDGFGVAHMKALLRAAGQEGHQHEELIVATAESDDENEPSLGGEFLTERLVLRACGQRLDLRLHEGDFPDWRRLKLGIEEYERVDGLTIAPRILGLVGKLREVAAVDLAFHGDKRAITFVARGETEVRGLLMPMRRPEKEDKEDKE